MDERALTGPGDTESPSSDTSHPSSPEDSTRAARRELASTSARSKISGARSTSAVRRLSRAKSDTTAARTKAPASRNPRGAAATRSADADATDRPAPHAPPASCVCTCGSERDVPAGERAEAPEDYRLLRDTDDVALRDMLLEAHRWIVVHCARRFADRGEPLDDLMQVGQIGLLKALERFDPEFGSSFATFAVPTVLGEIRRHFRDATWAVRVPRRLKDLHVELGPAKEHLTSHLGRSPSADELAEFLRVGVEDILESLEAGGGYRTAPLTVPGRDAEEPERDAPALEVIDTDLTATDDRVYVERLLATLPERERRIVTLRFFGELSQSEIAEIVGLSQVHVSRLLRASLTALQEAAGDRPLVFAAD